MRTWSIQNGHDCCFLQWQLTKSSTSFESSKSGLPSDEPIMFDPSPWCCRIGSGRRHSTSELIIYCSIVTRYKIHRTEVQSELWNNFKECYSIKLVSSPFQVSREATTNMDATSVTRVCIHHVFTLSGPRLILRWLCLRSFLQKGGFVRSSTGRAHLMLLLRLRWLLARVSVSKLASPSRWVLCKHPKEPSPSPWELIEWFIKSNCVSDASGFLSDEKPISFQHRYEETHHSYSLACVY